MTSFRLGGGNFFFGLVGPKLDCLSPGFAGEILGIGPGGCLRGLNPGNNISSSKNIYFAIRYEWAAGSTGGAENVLHSTGGAENVLHTQHGGR